MTPYVKKCAEKLGISDSALVDFYTPGFNYGEDHGKSIDEAVAPMRKHIEKHGSEAAAAKAVRATFKP